MFDKMTVNELKIACKVLRIDLAGTSKKSDLISLIDSTGLTYEDYLEASGEQFTYKEAEKKEVVVEEVKPVILDEKVVDSSTTDSVIIKMVYPRGALNVGNLAVFSIEEPYKIFKKAQAEEILRLGKDEVRVATPEEVASFYKVK